MSRSSKYLKISFIFNKNFFVIYLRKIVFFYIEKTIFEIKLIKHIKFIIPFNFSLHNKFIHQLKLINLYLKMIKKIKLKT